MLSAAAPQRLDVMEVDEDAPAELFYTSGTSANPKGVVLTHRNIYLHAIHVCLGLEAEFGAAELHTIPLFHANGWGVAHFLTMLGGKQKLLINGSRVRDQRSSAGMRSSCRSVFV